MNRRFKRLGGGILGVALIGSVIAATAWGGSRPAASQEYQYGKKVMICHHTGSSKNPFVTIVVSENAVPAHLKHGDTIGPCPDD